MHHEEQAAALIVGFEPVARMPGGIARYTRELWGALEVLPPTGLMLRRTHVNETLRPLAARAWARGVRLSFGATTHGHRDRDGGRAGAHPLPTSLHATSVFAPPRGTQPLVVTVHDMVPFTHADTLTRHGGAWHRAMITRAAHGADALVVPTHAVATGITQWFGPDLASRIHVAGGAASLAPVNSEAARELRAACGVGERDYVVFVGTIEPRKGVDVLLRAMAELSGLDVVIVGAQGWGHVNVARVTAAAGCDPSRVIITGPLHDTAVAAIIQDARALVLPSQAEGFGLPLVEAMRLGTPVVHSDDPALCEVAADAGVVAHILEVDQGAFDAQVESARILANAIERAIDERPRLIEAGLRRAQAFSWTESARQVAALHSSLVTRN